MIGRDIKQQCFPGEAKNIFINESSETRQFLGLYSVFFIDLKPDLIWQYYISSMPWFEDTGFNSFVYVGYH